MGTLPSEQETCKLIISGKMIKYDIYPMFLIYGYSNLFIPKLYFRCLSTFCIDWVHHDLFKTLLLRSKSKSVLPKQWVVSKLKCKILKKNQKTMVLFLSVHFCFNANFCGSIGHKIKNCFNELCVMKRILCVFIKKSLFTH